MVQKQKVEYKLIKQERYIAGHRVFEIDTNTLEVNEAEYEKINTINFFDALNMITNRKIVIRKNKVYIQALNKKNALKVFLNGGRKQRKNF